MSKPTREQRLAQAEKDLVEAKETYDKEFAILKRAEAKFEKVRQTFVDAEVNAILLRSSFASCGNKE